MTERPRIGIVTDSVASLPKKTAQEKEIGVVAASIIFDDQVYRDGIDIGTDKLLELMAESGNIPTTAAPPIPDYQAIYDKYPDQDVISVHVGSKFSGIYNNAVQAASESGYERITPYDSATVSMGIGYMTLCAQELAGKGASMEQIRQELDDMKGRMTVIAAIDSLSHLEKGGRVKKAELLLGSLMSIKPVLQFSNGEVHVIEKVRTRGKSLKRLAELAESFGQGNIEKLAVLHAGAEEEALSVVENMRSFYQDKIGIFDTGPALAIQAGPKVVGAVIIRKNKYNRHRD